MKTLRGYYGEESEEGEEGQGEEGQEVEEEVNFGPGGVLSSARAPNSGCNLENGGPRARLFHSGIGELVARMERSVIRGCPSGTTIPDCASLHPGYGRNVQRSANASLAPSAANPAAKLRRSQAIAFGRVMTRSRSEAANRP